jgi:hypothetical protein
MNIAKTKNRKSEKIKNVFHFHYRLERSITMGLIVMSSCLLTGALSGDALAGAFLVGSIFSYAPYARTSGYKYNFQKFDNSLDELFVVISDSGLELINRSDDLYIFKTKHRYLFHKERVLVRDCQEFCNVIAEKSILDCLSHNIVSKKV